MKDVEIASMDYSKQAQIYNGDENLTGGGRSKTINATAHGSLSGRTQRRWCQGW